MVVVVFVFSVKKEERGLDLECVYERTRDCLEREEIGVSVCEVKE